MQSTMEELAKKLLATGWQSWSNAGHPIFKNPRCNYPPFEDTSLPKSDGGDIKLKPPATGWCSWYAYGWGINHKKIIANAKWFQNHPEIPIEYILIDDGYTRWGDWKLCYKHRFPEGLAALAHEIKKLGFKPGIWIAPFMAHPLSRLTREHKDWLAQTTGKLATSWWFDNLIPIKQYLLDYRRLEVQRYLHECMDLLVQHFGFELIKFDFLYMPYFFPGVTIQEASDIVYSFLSEFKKIYPHVYTIASGCPLIPAVGAVDSIRIGPDITTPQLYNIPVINSLYNSSLLTSVLANIDKRLWTKTLWNLDPDVFVCQKHTGFSERQILTLQEAIKKCQGNILLGDIMPELNTEEISKYILPLFQP